MLVNVLTLVGMIGVMFYLNWRFTLIALSVAPVLFLVVYFYTRRIKKASRAVRKKEGELLSIVEEVLTSIRVVQAFAREDYEERRFDAESLANVEAGLYGAQHQGEAVAGRRGHRRDRHLPGARVRGAAGAGRQLSAGRADRLPAVSREDVQADARPVEDDRHGLQGGRRLRAHPGSAGHRKPRARHAAARDTRAEVQGRISFDHVSFSYDGHARPEGRQLHDRARTGRGDRRSVRHRQDDARQPDSALLRSGVRARRASTARTSGGTR